MKFVRVRTRVCTDFNGRRAADVQRVFIGLVDVNVIIDRLYAVWKYSGEKNLR